eukprot:gene3629-6445_t
MTEEDKPTWDDLGLDQKDQITTAFKICDPKDLGYINKNNLIEILKELYDPDDKPIPGLDIEKLALELLDQLGDGEKISFEEFREKLLHWWQ